MNWKVMLMQRPQSRFASSFAGSGVFHPIGLIGLATPVSF